MFVLGMIWLTYRQKKLAKMGIGFTEPENSQVSNEDVKVMHPILAFLPLVTVVVLLSLPKRF